MMPLPQQVSVAQPVGQAIERAKRMLFQPFDLGKWFTIGFCAWLAGLGQRGTHFNFNTHSEHGGGLDRFRQGIEHAWEYMVANLYWLLPLAAVLLLLGLAVWVLIIWLSSRGRFMFLHCVALDKAEVAIPWRKFAAQANSLFWFRRTGMFTGPATNTNFRIHPGNAKVV